MTNVEHRKVLIPLIDFRFDEPDEWDEDNNWVGFKPYQFKSLKARLVENYPIKTPLYSGLELGGISRTPFALEIIEYDDFKVDVHMLLLSFRIVLNHCISIRHYLYPDHPYACNRLDDTLKGDARDREAFLVSRDDLSVVDDFCIKAMDMERIPKRAHNAIFLLLRGCFDSNWIGAYLHWSCALETIFGRKKSGAGTEEIISRRISIFLNDGNYNFDKIKEFYNIRSRIVHGQSHIVLDDDSNINLDKLFEFWELVRLCFKKLIETEGYKSFKSEKKREEYFDSFLEAGTT